MGQFGTRIYNLDFSYGNDSKGEYYVALDSDDSETFEKVYLDQKIESNDGTYFFKYKANCKKQKIILDFETNIFESGETRMVYKKSGKDTLEIVTQHKGDDFKLVAKCEK